MSQWTGTFLGASIVVIVCVASAACGSGAPPAQAANAVGGAGAQGSSVYPSAGAGAPHSCAASDAVQLHDLSAAGTTDALVPCAKAGAADFSGAIKIETIPEGVHITIHATDDQVDLGLLGSDVKTRDAVIVYPRGKGQKAVEVPLVRTRDGYVGDKIVMWDELDKLNDEGTKFDIAVYDHDGTNGEASEEMHVSVAVSTGKSCEKARDEDAQTFDMRGGQAAKADLTDAQLGAPMRDSSWFASCGLADSAKAEICVAVKKGRPLGVSVALSPENKRVAACIDRSARKLHFPESDKLDVVHQKF